MVLLAWCNHRLLGCLRQLLLALNVTFERSLRSILPWIMSLLILHTIVLPVLSLTYTCSHNSLSKHASSLYRRVQQILAAECPISPWVMIGRSPLLRLFGRMYLTHLLQMLQLVILLLKRIQARDLSLVLLALRSTCIVSFFLWWNLKVDFSNLMLVLTWIQHDQVALVCILLLFVVFLKQLFFQLLILLLLYLLLHQLVLINLVLVWLEL